MGTNTKVNTRSAMQPPPWVKRETMTPPVTPTEVVQPTAVTWLPNDKDAQHVIDLQAARTWFAEKIESAKDSPITFFDWLTPARAEVILGNNNSNRVRAGAALFTRLVRGIKEGRWQVNGESLIIADTAELNDGQNRCFAVLQSGVSIKTCFVFGVGRDTRTSVDTGGVRTVAHALQMAGGFTYTTHLARVALLVMGYNQANPKRFAPPHADKKPDHQEIIDWCFDHPEVIDDIKLGEQIKRVIGGRVTTFAGIVHILMWADEYDADSFLEALKVGEGLEKGDPVLVLRSRLLILLRDKKKDDPEMVAALTFKAWNAYRAKKKIKTLTWRYDEDFPIPV